VALWTQSSQRYGFGPFEFDLWTGEVRKGGTKLRVQNQPLKVLAMLLAQPGELVTREQLREGLWPGDTFVDFERGLNTAVNRLRVTLNDSAENPHFVETVGRRGYRFIAPVSRNGSDKTETTSRGSPASSHVYGWPSDVGQRFPVESSAAHIPLEHVRNRAVPRRWTRVVAALIFIVAIVSFGYGIHQWRSHTAALPHFESLRLTRLTNTGKAEDVAISPDSSYVVYSQRDHDGVGLWLHHIATGSETQILPSEDIDFRGLTFSPDGNSVYFVRARKEIGGVKDLYAMPVLGGHARLLTKDIDSPVSFSPDGRRFVYAEGVGPPDGNSIHIANVDGTGDHVLATLIGTSPYFFPGPAWSPDGQSIVVALMLRGERAGYVLDSVSPIDGSVREVLWHAGVIGRPIWLPDSKTVLIELDDSTGRGQLWTVSLTSGKQERITNDLANWGIRVDATRDAHTISAIQWSVKADLWSTSIMNLAKIQQITNSGMPMVAAVPRRDGRILAVSGNDELWIMNQDGTGLAPFSNLHDLAPPVVCGDFVVAGAYWSGAFANQQAAPDTLKGTKLASGRLTVQRSYESGPVTIMRVDSDGLNPTKLAEGVLYSPTCSPDGKFVYYILMLPIENISRVPIQGGHSEIVGDVPSKGIKGTMRISPDGRFLAFPYDQDQPTWLSKLAVISTENGQTVNTFETPGGVYLESCLRWSPDGKGLQYLLTKGDVTNIWEQLLSGGPPHQVTKYTSGRIFDFNWSADGKQLFLSRGEVTSDVVLLNLTDAQ
jgi:eukaryotic-like serine/threonine-protein kinase